MIGIFSAGNHKSKVVTTVQVTWVSSDLSQDCTSACTVKVGAAYSCYLPPMWAIDTLAKTQALGCSGSNPRTLSDGWNGMVPFVSSMDPGDCYFNIPGQQQSTCEGSHIYRYRFCACSINQVQPTGQPSQQPSQQPTSRPSIQTYEAFAECTTGLKISGIRFCNGWSSYGNPNFIQSGATLYGVWIVPSTQYIGIPQSYPAGLANAVLIQQTGQNNQFANWDVSMNKTYSGVTPFTLYSLQFWLTSQNTGLPATFMVRLGGITVYSTLPQLNHWSQATTASICAPSSSLVVQFRATANGVQSAMAVAGINLVAGVSCTMQPSSQPSGNR